MSDYSKQFIRTKQDAETMIKRQREKDDRENCSATIFTAVNHMEKSLDKLMESIGSEAVTKNKEHIDNIFYHLGAIKGSIN